MKILLLGFILMLSSCATSYKPMGYGGGYKDYKVGDDMFHVSFKGNGYTGSDAVQEMFLRRCAEITRQQGFSYFAFVDQSASTSHAIVNSEESGTLTPNYLGGYNYTGGSSSYSVSKHEREGIIKLFKDTKQPPNAFNATIILKNFVEEEGEMIKVN